MLISYKEMIGVTINLYIVCCIHYCININTGGVNSLDGITKLSGEAILFGE